MRVIIAQWQDGRVECYSTLSLFLKNNPIPKRSRDTIDYHLKRKKNAGKYQDEFVTLYRIKIIRSKKNGVAFTSVI